MVSKFKIRRGISLAVRFDDCFENVKDDYVGRVSLGRDVGVCEVFIHVGAGKRRRDDGDD